MSQLYTKRKSNKTNNFLNGTKRGRKSLIIVALLLFCQLCQAQTTVLAPADIPPGNFGPFTKSISSQVFTFTPAVNNYVDYFGDVGTEGFSGLYPFDTNTYDGTEFTLSSPNGYTFDFNSFQYISDRGNIALTVTLTFANNATDVKSYTLNGNSLVQTFSVFATAANDIKSIRFVSDQLVYYNNLGVTDVKPLSALPLTWLDFSATRRGNQADLRWRTAAEHNTKDFVVQHSTDGFRWKSIGNVVATGINEQEQVYSFLHLNPQTGVNYYRLLQRDADGQAHFSKVVSLDLNEINRQVRVYPNPAINGVLTLQLQKAGTIQVYNSQGALVLEKTLPAGVHTLSLAAFGKGIYTVRADRQSTVIVLP